MLSCARLTDLHLLAGHLSDSGYAQRYIGETMLLTLRVQCSYDQRQVSIDDLFGHVKPLQPDRRKKFAVQQRRKHRLTVRPTVLGLLST